MSFAAIYIPDFLVQAVVRTEPALRAAAVALVDGAPPLWNVIAANKLLCAWESSWAWRVLWQRNSKTVQIRLRSIEQEKSAHAALLDLGWSLSPRVEDTAPDIIVIDLAGLAELFGSEESIANH